MPREIAGTRDGKGLRIGVVVARFNAFVTEGLLGGALSALREAGVRDEDVTLVRVPGAFEIPLGARALAVRGEVDAVVCLGAVIRGETPHFDYVSKAATDGVREVMLDYGLPLAFGVLTTNTVEQAMERSAEGPGNKGAEAVHTAIEMVRALRAMA
ncbi:MAG: 6,7-dimethyl-8-ribityllumazine synthase [Candidatus Binatia bacterium]